MGPYPIRLPVVMKKDRNTQREYCLMTGREWSDTPTGKGTPRIESHHQKQKVERKVSARSPSKKTTLPNLDFGLVASGAVRE